MMTCLSGDYLAATTMMKEKAQEWIGCATLTKLARRALWLLNDRQFRPKVGFGIGVNTAPLSILSECLMKQYYKLVPLGGIRRSANWMVRQLDGGFYGVGCMHPAVECLTSQATKLLTHYGCDTAVGRLLQILCELHTLELGMGCQPLMLDFSKYGAWAMNSWLKCLWEKTCAFGIHFTEGKLNLIPPQTGDEWIMPMLQRLGFMDKESLCLNKVRIHQQILFYLDVMDARGTSLRCYLSRRSLTDTWSTYRFPLQQPPRKDLKLWTTALLQLWYLRQGMTLGRHIAPGHKVWEWRYVEEEHSLLHFHDNIMDTYSPWDAPRYTNRPNCWSITQADQPMLL